MLFGTIPFKAQNMADLEKLIVSCNYKVSDTISVEAKDLLHKILEVSPKKRYKIHEILSH